MKFVALIPARFGSSRFPGKPLAMLCGKPVIQHVYERTCQACKEVYVCTDDTTIFETVTSFGGKAVLTSSALRSGTDRCHEAVKTLQIDADVIINVQGDEPFIDVSQIQALKECFDDPSTHIATLVKPFSPDATMEELQNPNSPKVVFDAQRRALYFSRSVIPYLRNFPQEEWLKKHTYYKHIGLYAYKRDVLSAISALPYGNLEQAESLEQLRWLEHGYCIKVGFTEVETIGIDTPQDLERAVAFLQSQSKD